MQELLAKIIEMDANARRLKEKAEKEKLSSEAEIEEMRQKIYDDYIARAKDRVEKNISIDRHNAQEAYDACADEIEQLSTQMQTDFEQNKEQWIAEIVERVIQG